MNICFICNNNYIEYLAAIIVSILKNSNPEDNFFFHVIEDEISDFNKKEILKLKEIKDFEIYFYKSPNCDKYKSFINEVKNIGNNNFWHYSTFYKLDIPIIFNDLDDILLLDVDMIVNCRINDIFEGCDLNHYIVALKRVHRFYNQDNFINWMKELGFKNPELEYLISGILYFNLKLIRENMSSNEILNLYEECFRKYKDIIFTEEHLFLYAFKNNISFHDFKFLSHSFALTVSDTLSYKDVYIYHFDSKPLSDTYDFRDEKEYYNRFWYYFSFTPFYKNNYLHYIEILCSQGSLLSKKLNRKIDIINKFINKLAWYIPIRSIRDKFRDKLKQIFEIVKKQ